jgi:hypothetical protein
MPCHDDKSTANTHHAVRARTRAFAVLLSAMLPLAGCAGAGMTLFGAGAGVAASTGVNYSLNGIAYKTFTAPDTDVHAATLVTLKRMGIKVKEDKRTKEGRTIVASAVDREISIELERVTRTATRMRVNVDKGEIFKDRATASEIIVQAAVTLENQVASRK